MKRCPECRRDYYDDTLLYCLDDGNALLEGPASGSTALEEPATAILSEPGAVATGFRRGEDQTRPKILTVDPGFVTGRLALGIALNANGFYEDAIRLGEESLQKEPTNQHMLLITGFAYARSGNQSRVEAVLNRFREIRRSQYAAPYYIATIHAALGNKDKAFDELENSLLARDWWLTRIKSDPLMESLRDDPRFKDLLKQMNLPE